MAGALSLVDTRSTAGRTVLAVDRLVAGYDGSAVAALSALELRVGESALLLGPSGSGKTTVLLAIAGLAQALSGRITIDGEALTNLAGSARDQFRGRHVGFVFQDIHLVAGLTVLENVLLAPFALGLPQNRQRAMELLELTGLAAQISQRAETLSRGQAQRVALARAMLLRPSLILADEPTASLDDDACETVIQLFEQVGRESGAALLIATHDSRLRKHFARTYHVESVP